MNNPVQLCLRDSTRAVLPMNGHPCHVHAHPSTREPTKLPRGIKEMSNSAVDLDLALAVPAPPCRSFSLSEPVNDGVIHQKSTMSMLREADSCSAGACMRLSARLFARHPASANQQNRQRCLHAAVASRLLSETLNTPLSDGPSI